LLDDGYLKVVLGLKELQTPLDLEDDHPRMSHKFGKKTHFMSHKYRPFGRGVKNKPILRGGNLTHGY